MCARLSAFRWVPGCRVCDGGTRSGILQLMLFILGQAIPSCGRRAFLVARDRGEGRGVAGHDLARVGVDREPLSRNLEGARDDLATAAGRDVTLDLEHLDFHHLHLEASVGLGTDQGHFAQPFAAGGAELLDHLTDHDPLERARGLRGSERGAAEEGEHDDREETTSGEGGIHRWTPLAVRFRTCRSCGALWP